MAKIEFSCDPVDMGKKLYLRNSVDIQPGITCLVGANGSGKTTFLRIIKERGKRDRTITVIGYSDILDGRQTAMDRYMHSGKMEDLGRAWMSSEGENVFNNFGSFVGTMGRNLHFNDKMEKPRELWILLDGLDSGLSIDRVVEVRKFIEWFVNEEVPKAEGTEVYILIAANAFEMCRGLRCLDVRNMKNVEFNDYEEYKNFVVKSGEKLKKRDGRED